MLMSASHAKLLLRYEQKWHARMSLSAVITMSMKWGATLMLTSNAKTQRAALQVITSVKRGIITKNKFLSLFNVGKAFACTNETQCCDTPCSAMFGTCCIEFDDTGMYQREKTANDITNIQYHLSELQKNRRCEHFEFLSVLQNLYFNIDREPVLI